MSDILDLIDGAISNHQWTGNDEMRWRPPDTRADESHQSGPITGVWFVPPSGEPVDLTPYIVDPGFDPTRRGPILNGSCTIRPLADTYGAFAAFEAPLTVQVRAYDRLSEAFQGLIGRVVAFNEAFGPRKAEQRARLKRMHSAYHRRRR